MYVGIHIKCYCRPTSDKIEMCPHNAVKIVNVQGGSNMTGTDLCVNLATSVPVIFEPSCKTTISRKSVEFELFHSEEQTGGWT